MGRGAFCKAGEIRRGCNSSFVWEQNQRGVSVANLTVFSCTETKLDSDSEASALVDTKQRNLTGKI